MGIRGLNSIVNENPASFKSIQLRDSLLVIDGNNISIQLYQNFCQKTVLNGDYSEYERCVKKFYAQLKQCNIFPIVILDGGHEERKLKKSRKKMAQRIVDNQMIIKVNFGDGDVFYPARITEVFKDVMSEMNIFFCQDLLEADLNILKTAQFLDCPLLSFDGDFYLEDVKYIPFTKLQCMEEHDLKESEEVSTSGSKHFLSAKLFERSNFLKRFGNLTDLSFLPLLSFLLGNDYSEPEIYRKFYQRLYRRINERDLRQKIKELCKWFGNFNSPEMAAEKFLEDVPDGSKQRTKEKWLRCLTEKSNSLEPSYLLHYIQHSLYKTGPGAPPLMLKKKIEVIEGSSEWLKKAAADMSPDETDTSNRTALYAPAKMSIPNWILMKLIAGEFPRNLMDLMYTQNFFFELQMEEHFLLSGEETYSATDHTLTILRSILGILYYNHPAKDNVSVRVYSRVGCRLDDQKITPIFPDSFPSLTEIPKLSQDKLRKIALDVLKINQVTIKPDSWELFFLSLASWYQADESEIMTDALGCIIFSSIFEGIIDKKVGYFKTEKSFLEKYSEDLKKINAKRQFHEGNSSSTKTIPSLSAEHFESAINKIELEDCIVALNHFFKFRERNYSLSESEFLFKPILHCFAQFLINIMINEILNSVLHLPFSRLKIADFYWGTLAYNIYFEIKKHKNLESFVESEFKLMPTLQALFLSAIRVVETLSNRKLAQQRKRKSRSPPISENIKMPKLA